MYDYVDCLFWLSIFSIQNEEEKKQLLKLIKEYHVDYTAQLLADEMLKVSGMNYSEYRPNNPCVQTACEHVALKFMLYDSNLAKDLLSEDDFIKAKEVYTRKQYNSKLLQKLLCDFLKLLSVKREKINLKNLFTIAIIDEFHKVQEDEINIKYGVLKKTMEKLVSGVKSNCYTIAECLYLGFIPLNDALNQFLYEKTNYNFNQANKRHGNNEMSTLFCNNEQRITNNILQLALDNDANFLYNIMT